MGKTTFRCITAIVLCLLLSNSYGQLKPFSEATDRSGGIFHFQPNGSIKIQGYLGHKDEGKDHLKQIVNESQPVFTASLPASQVVNECTFYHGDSLSGFDFDAASRQAEMEGNKMYSEFQVFMFRKQTEFVKRKYHIAEMPFETFMKNQRINDPQGPTAAACVNMDFEYGDFTNWVGASGYNQNSNNFITAAGTAFYNYNMSIYDCADLQLISSAYGNDPISGQPGLDPAGGAWSTRLGGMYINEASGYSGCAGYHWSAIYSNGEYIKQTFTVTPSNALVSFDYHVILNDGGHPAGQQPYFHAYVTNSSGTVLSTCTQYYVQAIAGVPPAGFYNTGFTHGGGALYAQGWTSNAMNLTPYIGQTVTLYFIAAGCTQGGHPAWAYVDGTCGPADIDVANVNPCTGSTTTMTAPPVSYGTYSWSGPGIVGSTTGQSITVNASGTYTCVVTPSQGASCAYTLTQSVTFINSPAVTASASPTSLCSGQSSTLNATGASNVTSYAWNPGGATTSSTVVTPGVGTNVYTLTVTNNGFCPVSKTVTVTVTAYPTVGISGNTSICSSGANSSATLTATGAASTYTWSPIPSNANQIVVNPTSTTSYTLTGANGACTASAAITVTVTPTPTLSISGTTTLCSGFSTVLTGTNATNYTWNPGAVNTNTISVSPGTGTTNYTLTGANGSCVSSKTVAVTVTATPTLSVSGATICSGTTAVLSNTGPNAGSYTYTWSPSGGSASSATVNPGGTTTIYTLNAANGACTSSTTAQVTVNQTPTLSVSGSSICSSNSTTLANSGPNAGSYTYTWSPSGGNSASAIVSPTVTTTYTLNSANGTCTASTTAQVTVTATPTLNVSGATKCSGSSTTVLTNTGPNAGSYTYTWSPTGGSASSATVTPTSTTVYTLNAANGACTSSTTAQITVNQTPTLSVSGSAICSATSTTLTNGGPNAGSYTYTWSPSGGNAVSAVVSPTVTTTYTLNSANGTCTASATAQVTVTATPTLNVAPQSICSGTTSVVLSNTGPNAGSNTYTWSPTGGSASSATVSPTSTTTYTLFAANGACTSSTTAQVTINQTPTLAVNGSSICSATSTTLTNSGPNAGSYTYTWSPSGGNSVSAVVSPTVTTTYTLLSANGTCTASTTAQVTVTATPTLSLANASICSGTTAVLTNTGPNAGSYTYTWSPSTGSSTSSATVSPTSTTAYTLTAANGACTKTISATVSVTPTPSLTITGAAGICSGNTIALGSTGTASNYSWTPSGGTASTATVSPSSTTAYTLTGTNGSCTGTVSAVVTVTTTPSMTITPNSQICNGSSVNLSGGSATNYTWLPGNQNTSSIAATPTTTTTYTLTGANGTCTATAMTTVTVNPLPVIGSASITAAPCGQSTGCINSVSVSGGTPSYTYSWNGGAGSTSSQYCNHPAGSYVLVVTDAKGCQATQNFSIPSQSGPSAPQVAASSTVACVGDNVTLNITSPASNTTYSWTSGSGSATGTSYTVTNIGPSGSYPVSVSATDNSGCVSSATTVTITVNPLPNINASASPTVICTGQSTMLNASGATTYTWDSNAGSAGTNTVSVSPSASTVYTVSGSSLGCSSSQTVAVSVNPLPTVTANAAPTTICAGQSTVLTAGGATTYTWSTGAPTQTVSVSPASTATYVVTGSTNGCTSTQTVSVHVTQLPAITATPAPASICVGQTTTITAGGAGTYTWSSNSGGGNATSVAVSPTVTTTYTLAGTQNNCSDSTTVTVNIGTPPTLTVSTAANTICSGTSTTLTATGATSYTWMPGSIPTGTATVSPTSNTIYTVTATAGGCPSTETVAVNVTATPTLVINSTSSAICSGVSDTLTATGSTTYTWSPGGATTNTLSVSPVITTTYTVASDNSGCSSTQTVVVNVTATPTVSASSSQTSVCSAQNSATLTAGGATSYTWSSGGQNSIEVVTPTVSTTYTVTGANGNCTDTATVSVNVTQTPVINVTATAGSNTVCAGTTATLTASGATTYTWQPGAVTGSTFTATPSSTTTYSVTGENNGCPATYTTVVTVNQLPTITLASTGDTACAGSPVNGISFNAGSAQVNWTNGNGNIGIPTVGQGDISQYNAPNVTTQEVGIINASAFDSNTGCSSASQSYTVVINPTPQATSGGTDSALCGKTDGGIKGVHAFGGVAPYTYQWYNNGTLIPGATDTMLTNVGMGNYNVVITDANGCVAPATSTTFTVYGTSAVVAGFGADMYTGQAPLSVTFTNTTTGANAYNWNFGNGSVSTSQNAGTQFTSQGTYTVLLTAYNGSSCFDTATAVIIIDASTSIIIPNIYSPNGDGVNDEFMIQCTGMRTLKCDIFNRWGQLVYTLNGPNDVWDGVMLNGNVASEGTYFYILNAEGYDNKPYKAEGHLTLVK